MGFVFDKDEIRKQCDDFFQCITSQKKKHARCVSEKGYIHMRLQKTAGR